MADHLKSFKKGLVNGQDLAYARQEVNTQRLEFGATGREEHVRTERQPLHAWIKRVVEDALVHVRDINFSSELESRGTRAWQALLIGGVIILLYALLNRPMWQGNMREMVQAGFVAPQPLPELVVAPGDTKVKKSAQLLVSFATLNRCANNRRSIGQQRAMIDRMLRHEAEPFAGALDRSV